MNESKLAEALRNLLRYSDGILCYASTMGEHEPNKLVYEAQQALASYEAQAEAKPADEREAFEAWAGKQIGLSTDGRVNYAYGATRDAWEVWQARAALEAKPAPAMLLGEDPRIEPVRNVLERICGTRQSATNFARRILGALDAAPAAPAPADEPTCFGAGDAVRLRASALAVFDGPECPQIARDVIEWYHSSLLVEIGVDAAPAAPAPAGFVLVPVEPTPEMLKRFDGFEFRAPFDPKHAALREGLWRSILNAAPAAPAPADERKERPDFLAFNPAYQKAAERFAELHAEPVTVDHHEFSASRGQWRATIWTEDAIPTGTKLYAAPAAPAPATELSDDELDALIPQWRHTTAAANEVCWQRRDVRQAMRAAIAAAPAAPAPEPLTIPEVCDLVDEAGLDWQKGWTVSPSECNRFLQLAMLVQRACLNKWGIAASKKENL